MTTDKVAAHICEISVAATTGALAVLAVQRGWRRVIVALLSRGDT
jgi:hypothetical protein